MVEQRACLLGQFVDRLLAGTRYCLVSRHVNTRDSYRVLDGLECHHHLYRRAIRIGDDAAILVLRDGMRIHFRHHQRNIPVVAEVRGIVDHHATGSRSHRRVLFRDAAACREQTDLGFGKVESFHVYDGKFLSLEAHCGTRRTAGSERVKIAHRELALFQYRQHRLSHRSGRA